MEAEYLTLAQASVLLRISKSTLYKKTHKREIRFFKPGGKLIRFLKSDLLSYMASNLIDSKEEIENKYLNSLNQKK